MSADLRAIFRDELEDLVGALERASARLEAGDPGAALEIRRAFHTLKGAAQAVGEDAVERAEKELEALTKTYVDKIDAELTAKEKDLMTV